MRSSRASPLLSLVLLLPAQTARAHPMNVAYADITVKEDEIDIALSANLFELDLLLLLDRNGDAAVDEGELAAGRERILDYLRRTIAVSASGRDLPMEAGALRIGLGNDARALLEVALRFRAGLPLREFAVRCEPLSDLGPDHRTLARIARDGKVEEFVFQKGVWYRAAAAGIFGWVGQFLQLGIFHILTGYDHILFLAGLLIVGGSLRGVVKIVTSFTAAHSITLSLAALDLVRLPPRIVEAGIAASIVYVAVENLFFRTFDRRWLVSFFFGLVHGFGFASALGEMHLPRSGLVSSLFAFNAGVEVGQLAIVLLILPLLWALRRSRACGAVTVSASALILVVGVLWLCERAL